MASRLLEYLTNPRKLAIILLVVSILIASGFFYVIINRPPPMAGAGFIWPSPNGETGTEMLVVAFLYGITLGGLWLVYDASRYRYRGSYVNQALFGGSLIFILALVMLILIVNVMK